MKLGCVDNPGRASDAACTPDPRLDTTMQRPQEMARGDAGLEFWHNFSSVWSSLAAIVPTID